VYPLEKSFHPETYREIYVEDRSEKHELGFFVRSTDYRMWGFIRSDLHLFGIRDNPEAKLTLLGRDSLGRDQFSRLIFGARISLTIGFVGMFLGFFPSVFLGGVAGLFGGAIDKFLMRVNEIVGSIPTLPLWIALTAALPTKIPIVLTYFYLTLIMAGVSVISGGSRTIRGKFMAIKAEDFVTAARLDNARTGRLIFKYMLPSFMSHIIADLTLGLPGMILGETGLSFIGLGLQEPAISWGVMLQECRSISNLRNAPWLFSSAVLVLLTILAFNFVGDGLRDAVDPYASI
jgi:peptide/nickel transport system permease protein